MRSSPQRPFCIVPWVHAYRGPDGFRALCCLTTDIQAEFETLSEWWNSATVREARLTFLAGQVPAACRHCVNSNRLSHGGYNDRFTALYGALIPEIRARTLPDGSTSLLPRSIDYRASHCNLRCRTCDARNASTIAAEYVRTGYPLPRRAASGGMGLALEPATLAHVQDIYWAGGEPFLSPIHRPTMQALMACGRAPAVNVHYHSNLMHWNAEIEADVRTYASAFDSLDVVASIDGLGEVGAYIRQGWDEGRFFSNLSALANAAPRAGILLDVTLTNVGLLHLHTLLERCAQERLAVTIKLMECNDRNDFLDVNLLRPEVVDACLRRCEQVGLDPYHLQRVAELRALLQRRYAPAPFTARHAELAASSEALRGGAGFFARCTRGMLNDGDGRG